MIDLIVSWWRARTMRERLLLQAAAVFVCAVLIPLAAYQGAARYRADAAADLAAARAVQQDVARLAAAGVTPAIAGDDTLRGIALALAAETGLTPERIEPAGPDNVRVTFAAADSLRVYRWMEGVGRHGVQLRSTALTRTGAGAQVVAEFSLARSP